MKNFILTLLLMSDLAIVGCKIGKFSRFMNSNVELRSNSDYFYISCSEDSDLMDSVSEISFVNSPDFFYSLDDDTKVKESNLVEMMTRKEYLYKNNAFYDMYQQKFSQGLIVVVRYNSGQYLIYSECPIETVYSKCKSPFARDDFKKLHGLDEDSIYGHGIIFWNDHNYLDDTYGDISKLNITNRNLGMIAQYGRMRLIGWCATKHKDCEHVFDGVLISSKIPKIKLLFNGEFLPTSMFCKEFLLTNSTYNKINGKYQDFYLCSTNGDIKVRCEADSGRQIEVSCSTGFSIDGYEFRFPVVYENIHSIFPCGWIWKHYHDSL